eukprot:6598522-Prymnesium_polylepis.1
MNTIGHRVRADAPRTEASAPARSDTRLSCSLRDAWLNDRLCVHSVMREARRHANRETERRRRKGMTNVTECRLSGTFRSRSTERRQARSEDRGRGLVLL